jgi:hypothetical protein
LCIDRTSIIQLHAFSLNPPQSVILQSISSRSAKIKGTSPTTTPRSQRRQGTDIGSTTSTTSTTKVVTISTSAKTAADQHHAAAGYSVVVAAWQHGVHRQKKREHMAPSLYGVE